MCFLLLLFSCKSVRCAPHSQTNARCMCKHVCLRVRVVCVCVFVLYVYGWSAALHHSQTLSPLWVVVFVVLVVGGQSRCYAALLLRQLLSSASPQHLVSYGWPDKS